MGGDEGVPVPFYGAGFPDGWTPRVRALLGALAGRDVDGAAIAAKDLVDGPDGPFDVVELAGLLWATLAALWGLDHNSPEMNAQVQAVLLAAGGND